MLARLPGRLLTATALVALSGTALVAGAAAPGSAADATVSNSSPITYTCHTQAGNFTIGNTFTVPVAIESGSGAPAIPISDVLTFTDPSTVGQLLDQGALSTLGGTLSGGFGLYGSGYDASFSVPPLSVSGLAGSVTITGTLTAPSSGVGAEQLTAPLILTLAVEGNPLLADCTLDDESKAAIGTLQLTAHNAPTAAKTTAKAGPHQTIVVTGPNGPVSATTKVKGKAKTVRGTIANGKATLHYGKLKLPQGKHTFAVKTTSGKASVTVTVR